MATAYPKFTSASTGLTTWSDGSTSSVSNPTPTKATSNQTASISLSGLTSILNSLSKTLASLMGKSSGGGMQFPVGAGLSVEQQRVANQTLGKYTGGTSNYASQPLYGPPKPTANTGIASKQAQPVLNAQGQAITGAYTKGSGGSYYSVPTQSLGYTAGITTGNLDKVKNIQKAGNNFNLQLNDAKKSAWDSMGTKADKMSGLMESTAGELSRNFNSIDEFNLDYNSNPSIKSVLDQFVANGGTLEQIMSKIQANQQQAQPYTIQQGDTLSGIASRTGKSVAEIMSMNPQITNPNLIQAGASLNLGANVQDSQAYLSEMKKNVITDPEALLKLPQDKLLQNEIARQAGIPDQWKDYYLGTPEKIGVFELEKAQKQAQLDLIEEKLSDDKRVYKEKAKLQIDKTRNEMDVALAETETNRLKAKNYMTGLLAKLGALNTTGAAGEALVKLDQKYEEMKMNTRNKYSMAIRELEIEMNEGIDAIENGYTDKANKIREDLTKSATDITKELMKLDLEAQSKIYSLSTSYSKLLQTQKEKAQKAIKAGADGYVKDFQTIVAYGPTLDGSPLKIQVPKANFSQTEKNKLIRAGLSNASQQEQLDYLYGKTNANNGLTADDL